MARAGAAHWWGRFLRGLRRTGNVRVAALGAGVNHCTAYGHRRRDAGFARRWARAVDPGGGIAREDAPAPPAGGAEGPVAEGARQAADRPKPGRPEDPSGNPREELVARRSKKHGVQMVRVAEGRYSAKRGEAFLGALRATGCVKRAAAAAGLSTTSFYKRRGRYPGFAAEWAAAEADAKAQLHGFVLSAGIAAFDPDGPGDADAPKVTVSEAIAILRLKGTGHAAAPGAAPGSRAGQDAEEVPIETVRDEVLRQVAAIRRKGAEREREREQEEGGA